jgi:two-component system sensor histidine kinase ChiS
MSLVNGYLSSVTPAIQEAGGHIVQYQGDGVLAVFPDGVGGGIRASQKMQEAISLYSQEYFEGTTHKLKMGVGLHYGQVEMGIIGNEDRWESTVIADAVNTAARIESLTKPLGAEILISDVVYNAYESRHAIETRRLGEFDVKGRANRVALREVLSSLDAEQRELRLETRTLFEGGVDALTEGDVSEAVLAFDEVIRKNPQDVAARVLQRRVLQGALTS